MIVGVLQARTGSRRLPDKVLAPILGRPMLARQVERLRRARRLERLVVATSNDASDDRIETLCGEIGIDCHRGSLDDVLDRVYRAACASGATQIVRLTADCPLADPSLVDRVVALHLEGGYDYSSNALARTFPDGLDVEVVRRHCLEEAWREAREPFEREHVTPFLYRRPERYRLGSLEQREALGELRWTVDEPADLAFVRCVYEALHPSDPDFGTDQILDLLARRPEIASINSEPPGE